MTLVRHALLEYRSAMRFFPTFSMTVQMQVNAIMRFGLYYSAIVSSYTFHTTFLSYYYSCKR